MKRETVGLAQSVKARLLDRARNTRVDPNHVLTRYANERFIYRLSCTEYRERVVLKGAMLLVAWIGDGLRPTRDYRPIYTRRRDMHRDKSPADEFTNLISQSVISSPNWHIMFTSLRSQFVTSRFRGDCG